MTVHSKFVDLDGMNETINFCLSFDSGLANAITAYSRFLSLGLSTDYVLSPEALPHVSILKLNSPPDQAGQIWTELESRLPKRISLQFSGISLKPGPKGDVWIMLNVARSAELVLLQEMASSTLMAHGPRSAVGDQWWPHVTLLHSLDGRLPANWALDAGQLMAADVVAVPVLGINRTPGLLVEIVHRPGF